MRIRTVRRELEARLEPPLTSPTPAARGKAEWKVYGDGTRQGRVSVSGLGLPDGEVLDLMVDERRIAHVTVQGNRARYRRETERGESVPEVDVEQVLRVISAGNVLLEGRFHAE
jgi:hypothetical protein